MTRRLNATALAERRYEVAKMNREGMTLAEIGEKLGVDASTVCRDMAWVREEWRKSVVENYDQARAVELAKLNYVERCCWEAWEGRGHVRETRIVVRRLPDGGLTKKGTGTATHSGSTCTRTQDMAEPVPFSSALPDGEGGATVCVANHDEEHRATPADHDRERGAAYVCEKRETEAGKLSELEGVVKCINKRWKLLEALRPKESRLAPRRNSATRKSAPSDDAPRREQQAGWEGESALQPMHCVRHAGRDGRVAAKVDKANGPTPSRMNRWPVGPELCFDRARPQGVALGWENQGPSAQEHAAFHGTKLAHFRPTPIYDSGSSLRGAGVFPSDTTCRPAARQRDGMPPVTERDGIGPTTQRGSMTPAEPAKSQAALQPMHCVRHAGRDGRVAAKVDSQGRKPSFMHTSRKPQCFNELQNRTNWSCSDRTFTISPIFRAKRIPAETALQVKTEMCASTRAEAPGNFSARYYRHLCRRSPDWRSRRVTRHWAAQAVTCTTYSLSTNARTIEVMFARHRAVGASSSATSKDTAWRPHSSWRSCRPYCTHTPPRPPGPPAR